VRLSKEREKGITRFISSRREYFRCAVVRELLATGGEVTVSE
jgi:hypothetical protein